MIGWEMPGRWTPLRELQREVGRILQTVDSLQGGYLRAARPFPAMNLYDAGDRFILTAEMPGVPAEELDLSLTGETLTLRGERKRPEGITDDRYRREERPFGRWSRTVSLPERIDGAGVQAECVNGMLTVILPKAEEARPRQIVVTAGGGN